IHKIREGIYPGLVDTPPQFKPVPRIPVSAIPLVFKNIFKKTLSVNPEDRSNFASIIKAEDGVTSHLVQCSKVKSHWYDEREKTCGWCAHADKVSRSEEHTSELQSRFDLVCRLLLEKKNISKTTTSGSLPRVLA